MPYHDPEQAKSYRREYYLKNKDKYKAYNHKHYQEHKEDYQTYNHEYYLAHKEQINAYHQRYYQEHIDKLRADGRTQSSKYCMEHREQKKTRMQEYDQIRKFPYHKILEDAGRERVCEFCGTTENVHTHHKDLNHDNNELDNLQWLCGSCHSKLHNELRRETRNNGNYCS